MTSDIELLRFTIPLITHPATAFVGPATTRENATPVVSVEDLEKLLDRLDPVKAPLGLDLTEIPERALVIISADNDTPPALREAAEDEFNRRRALIPKRPVVDAPQA